MRYLVRMNIVTLIHSNWCILLTVHKFNNGVLAVRRIKALRRVCSDRLRVVSVRNARAGHDDGFTTTAESVTHSKHIVSCSTMLTYRLGASAMSSFRMVRVLLRRKQT
jgi:hypothetical protein